MFHSDVTVIGSIQRYISYIIYQHIIHYKNVVKALQQTSWLQFLFMKYSLIQKIYLWIFIVGDRSNVKTKLEKVGNFFYKSRPPLISLNIFVIFSTGKLLKEKIKINLLSDKSQILISKYFWKKFFWKFLIIRIKESFLPLFHWLDK